MRGTNKTSIHKYQRLLLKRICRAESRNASTREMIRLTPAVLVITAIAVQAAQQRISGMRLLFWYRSKKYNDSEVRKKNWISESGVMTNLSTVQFIIPITSSSA